MRFKTKLQTLHDKVYREVGSDIKLKYKRRFSCIYHLAGIFIRRWIR